MSPEPQSDLTPKELDVVRDVVAGYSNHEIALHLNIAEATVKFRLLSIFNKLGVSSRLEIVLRAPEHANRPCPFCSRPLGEHSQKQLVDCFRKLGEKKGGPPT